MMKPFGRQQERSEFDRIYYSERAEFVAVYGRRRVGKTFLVREMYSDEFAFCHTGLSPIEGTNENRLQDQLKNFHYSLMNYGEKPGPEPVSWLEAFNRLALLLEKKRKKKRLVVFIDELPWLDTPRSGFITGLEHFWNGWGAGCSQLMLIVCGSATSWITDNLINNTGGLYGRLTAEIKLSPFTLGECEQYYGRLGIKMDRLSMLQMYMAIGGIPYYMDMLRPGLSLAQNIDNLFFGPNAKLANEYDRMFSSIFTNPENYKNVIRLLSQRRIGFTRTEIARELNMTSGGGLTAILKALEVSDFIMSYIPFDGSHRDLRYKLCDPYCLFYEHFSKSINAKKTDFWKNNENSPLLNAWRGYAFEDVCFSHSNKIREALGIAGVETSMSSWMVKKKNEDDFGAQIDMVINRADNVINLCEIKFSKDIYSIDKDYASQLRHKVNVFENETKTRRNLHTTLVTTCGLAYNEYSGIIQKVVTMDSLF